MTNEQQADTTEFNGVDTVLTKWNPTWTGNVATTTSVTKFRAKLKINKDLAVASGADNSGFSENKNKAKKLAGDECADLAGIAEVRFRDLGLNDLANQLDIHNWNYTGASDGNCEKMLKANSKLMRDNIASLTPDYVVVGDLNALDLLIGTYVGTSGTSESVHSDSPEITANYEASFVPVKESIDDLNRVVKKQFNVTAAKFVEELFAAAKRPTVNVHHTIISISATKKSDGSAAEGIKFSETKSGKWDITNYKGEATINQVRSGEDLMTGTLNGVTVYSSHIKNKRGTNNHYTIVIESL